jgi:DNA-binding beta-propeller fold protein YncE
MGIWVGRYAIVSGEVREHSPWLAERDRVREDDNVRLLVLAEPVDERSAPFCSEVAGAVAELFARESLSLTGGLQRALRQAHANLAEWNRRSLREHQVAVGLTCVAVRDAEATIGQLGPGAVYVSGPEGVLRYGTEGSTAAPPLGGEDAVQPAFFSVDLDRHLVLLVTEHAEQLVGANTIVQALIAGPERVLAELYLRSRGVADMTAVAVSGLAAEQALATAVVPDAPPPPPALEEPWSPPPPPAPVDSGSELAPGPEGAAAPLPDLRRDSAAYTAAREAGRLRPQRTAGQRSAGPHVTGAGRSPFGAPLRARRPPVRALGLAALALAAVALAWCTLPGLISEDRGAQLDDAVRSAQTHLSAAANAADAAASREELQAALADLERARAISADDPRLPGLRAQAEQALAALDAVIDLGDRLRRVVSFGGVITAPFAAGTAVAGGGAVWVTDTQRGRVFRIDPAASGDQQAVEVFRTGSAYGGVTSRDVRTVTWDATGARLLVLDSALALFAIPAAGGQPAPIPLRGVAGLRSVAALAAYNGNLYVLDPQGGEVWRYLPGGPGFDSERQGLLGGLDLADARSLAVDGDLYVLGGQGVRHFRVNDRELAPLLTGIDRPLEAAAGLAVDPARRAVYIGDRGQRRIVVADRDGPYRRQFRHAQFVDLRAIALAPDGAVAYVLTGDAVYAFALDPEGRAAPGATGTPGATPGPAATAPAAAPTAAAPTATATATPAGRLVYVVVAGDNAATIAQRFGITLEQLAAANNRSVAAIASLQIGDRLVIPAR